VRRASGSKNSVPVVEVRSLRSRRIGPGANLYLGAYEESHTYRQATNPGANGNGPYRGNTNSPQLSGDAYLPPNGHVPHPAPRMPIAEILPCIPRTNLGRQPVDMVPLENTTMVLLVIPDMLMMLLLRPISEVLLSILLNILPSTLQGTEIPGMIQDMPRSTRIR
jgi:hypothetical protein